VFGGGRGVGAGGGLDYRGCYDPIFEFSFRDSRIRDLTSTPENTTKTGNRRITLLERFFSSMNSDVSL